MLTIGGNPKLQVEIQSLEATDLHSYTYSGEELLQGFQCEVQVYSLNNLKMSESQCLKNNLEFPESQCLKNNLEFPECQCLKYNLEFPECQCLKARCLGRKVTRNRLFLILRPANVSQAFGPRRKNIDKSVLDVNDLVAFPPLGKHLPVNDSCQQVSIKTKKTALRGRSVWDQGSILVSTFVKYMSKQMTYPPFDFLSDTDRSQRNLQESSNAGLEASSASFSHVEIKAERTQTMDSRPCIDPPDHQDILMNANSPRDSLRRGQDLTKVQDDQSHSGKDDAQTFVSCANPSVNVDSTIDGGAVMEESLPHASSVSETVPKVFDDKSLYSQSRERPFSYHEPLI